MTADQKQDALKVGQLAYDMARGFAAHDAAINVVPQLLRDGNTFVRLIRMYPTSSVERKDGSKWSYDTQDAVGSAVWDQAIIKELPLVWLTGALLAVGDALERNGYFDRAPELELIRHLRNGIAHGNRFHIRDPEKLKKYPAHNRDGYHNGTIFKITPELDGQPVLFDFIGAGDVLDLLHSVGHHLKQMGAGKAPPPIITEAERQELIKRRDAALGGQRNCDDQSQP
jgi:hypothetical protein